MFSGLRSAFSVGLLGLLLLFLLAVPYFANGQMQWTQRVPAHSLQDFSSVCHHDGLWTAVGDEGLIANSTDGLAWEKVQPITNHDLVRVVHGNGYYVAVGKHGTILTSTDAIIWEHAASGIATDLTDVAFGNGVFVALASLHPNGTVISSNGSPNSWAVQNLPNDPSGVEFPKQLVFAFGKFFAFPRQGGNSFESADGSSWELIVDGAPEFSDIYRVKLLDSTFYACGNNKLATSVDGRVWSITSIGSPIGYGAVMDVTKIGSLTLVLGGTDSLPKSATSEDLDTWTTRQTTARNAVASNGSELVAVGNNGSSVQTTDGIHWSGSGDFATRPMVFDGTQFRSFEKNQLYSSPDAETWTAMPIPFTTSDNSSNQGFYRADSKFLVPTNSSKEYAATDDFLHWTIHPDTLVLRGLAHHDGTFVAIDSGQRLSTSPDAATWTTRLTPSTNIKGLAYGNGRFVAVGGNNTKFFSAWSLDGVVWDSTTETGPALGTALAFGNGRFAALAGTANDPEIRTSTDGITWNVQPLPSGIARLDSLTFTGNRFVASGASGQIAYSTDGITWLDGSAPIEEKLGAALFGNGKWIFPCRSLMQSDDFHTWKATYPQGSEFKAVVYGDEEFVAVGHRLDNIAGGMIWRSPDGIEWQPVHRSQHSLTTVAYGDGLYVAGSDDHLDSVALVSEDGLAWNEVELPIPHHAVIHELTYGNGRFLGLTMYDGILTSTDGVGWSLHPMPSWGTLADVIFANSNFYAVGSGQQGGFVAVSSDGTDWVEHHNAFSQGRDPQHIAHSQGWWVVSDTSGNMFESQDGINWTLTRAASESVPNVDSRYLTELLSVSGLFVGIDFLQLTLSEDRETWSRQLVPAKAPSARALGFGAGTFVLVTQNGEILTSPLENLPVAPELSLEYLGSRTVDLQWNGHPEAVSGYEIEVFNQTSWSLLPVIGPDRTSFTIQDLDPNVSYRFRIRAITPNGSSPPSELEEGPFTTLLPIVEWRRNYLGNTENVGEASNHFDQDGDGSSNIEEYAFCSDPTDPDSRPQWTVQFIDSANGGGETILRAGIMLDTARNDVSLQLKLTSDLKNWNVLMEGTSQGLSKGDSSDTLSDPLDTNPTTSSTPRLVNFERILPAETWPRAFVRFELFELGFAR